MHIDDCHGRVVVVVANGLSVGDDNNNVMANDYIVIIFTSRKVTRKMFLSPKQALEHGLNFLNIRFARWSDDRQKLEFHKHYGSSPLDVADIWHDFVSGDHLSENLKLTKEEKT
jgi:hypothetical protein